MENSPSAIMSCVLCGGLSALLSISWTKLETVFVAIWTHLKSSAYGLVLSPVSVNYILEQGVGQLSTHVAKTLGNPITDGTVIATLRSFSQSSRTNVKYSREEISCVFSTYLLYTLTRILKELSQIYKESLLPQVLCKSPQILASFL